VPRFSFFFLKMRNAFFTRLESGPARPGCHPRGRASRAPSCTAGHVSRARRLGVWRTLQTLASWRVHTDTRALLTSHLPFSSGSASPSTRTRHRHRAPATASARHSTDRAQRGGGGRGRRAPRFSPRYICIYGTYIVTNTERARGPQRRTGGNAERVLAPHVSRHAVCNLRHACGCAP